MDQAAHRAASNVRIGARIRSIRELKGLTIPRLAGKAGVSERNLQRWESGKHEVGVTSAIALAHALGMDLSTLLGQHLEDPPREEPCLASDVDALVEMLVAVEGATSRIGLVASPGLRHAVEAARKRRASGGGGQTSQGG